MSTDLSGGTDASAALLLPAAQSRPQWGWPVFGALHVTTPVSALEQPATVPVTRNVPVAFAKLREKWPVTFAVARPLFTGPVPLNDRLALTSIVMASWSVTADRPEPPQVAGTLWNSKRRTEAGWPPDSFAPNST